MAYQPVIKWSGSKRSQAKSIIDYFPSTINTYYEPFVGGGSVLYTLLHSEKKAKHYICSDINKDLIALWNMIKENPQQLINSYNQHWHTLNTNNEHLNPTDYLEQKKKYFYQVRDSLNTYHKPEDFLFILRTTTNGLVRYNQKGEFNNSFHITRNGIHPEKLARIIQEWSAMLNQYDVYFCCRSYDAVQSQKGDVVYLDPPYANTKGMYFGAIDYEMFWEWLTGQEGNYFLSFDGKSGDLDNTYQVPTHLYTQHEYLSSGCSSFKRLRGKGTYYVQESLYIK